MRKITSSYGISLILTIVFLGISLWSGKVTDEHIMFIILLLMMWGIYEKLEEIEKRIEK